MKSLADGRITCSDVRRVRRNETPKSYFTRTLVFCRPISRTFQLNSEKWPFDAHKYINTNIYIYTRNITYSNVRGFLYARSVRKRFFLASFLDARVSRRGLHIIIYRELHARRRRSLIDSRADGAKTGSFILFYFFFFPLRRANPSAAPVYIIIIYIYVYYNMYGGKQHLSSGRDRNVFITYSFVPVYI